MKLFGKQLLKSLATLLATLLAYESFAVPLAQATMLPQHTVPVSTNHFSETKSTPQIPSKNKIKSEGAFRVPASVGSIVEVYAPSKSSRLVYHLQDVHNHVPAQINLSEIVSLLETHAAKQGKSLVIAVEGVTGFVNSDEIAKLPNQKAKEDVAAGLLQAGYLMGEEYAAITHAPGRIKLIGMEDPNLYKKNTLARDASKAARKQTLTTIHETQTQLQKLIPHNFNSLLTRLEKKRLEVEQGTMPLTDYVAFLKSIDSETISRHPNLARLVQLSLEEAGIDFDKVEKEGKLLVQEVMAGKSDEEMDQMLADAQALKEGRISPLSYYSILLGQSKYPSPVVSQYVAYLRASEAIDADQLFDEVLAAEAEVAKQLIRHPLALQLYTYLRWMEQQERFFSLNMIPQEWDNQRNVSVADIYKQHNAIRSFVKEQVGDLGYRFKVPSFSTKDLLKAYEGARGFYEAAAARDNAMITNLDNILKVATNENAVVAFIAGGFHTPGMSHLLRSKGLAYEVIRPQLETEVELSQEVSYPSKTVNYLRAPELTATEPGLKAVEQQIENGPNPKAIQDAAQQSQPTEKESTPESKGGIVDESKKIVKDIAKPDQLNDATQVLVFFGALAVLAVFFGFIYFKKLINGARKAVLAPSFVLTTNKIDIDSGIDLTNLDKQSKIQRMLVEAAELIGFDVKNPIYANDAAGLNKAVNAFLSDKTNRDRAIDAYNLKVGGLEPILNGKTIQDLVSPTPVSIHPNVSKDDIRDFLASVQSGNKAWMISAGGRATRMRLPKAFDALGIAGLTPAILKVLKESGYTDPKLIPNGEDFMGLINQAINPSSDVEAKSSENLSIIQRQLLQLMYQVRSLAESNPELGFDADRVLQGLRFVVTVNSSNRDAIGKQLARLNFTGSIILIDQPEIGGVTIPASDGEVKWDANNIYPEGHGEPFIAMVQRVKGGYELKSNGTLKPLDQTVYSALEEQGVQQLFFGQVNDLRLLEDAASLSRFVTASQETSENGAGMVIEVVRNTQKIKVGATLPIPNSDFIILRDPLAMKTPKLASYIPEFGSRMLYIFDFQKLGRLNWNSMPNYLVVRKDLSTEKEISITSEFYSGDASSALNAKTMQQDGVDIKTFKDRSKIDLALESIGNQDTEKFSKFVDEQLAKKKSTLGVYPRLRGVYAAVPLLLLVLDSDPAFNSFRAVLWIAALIGIGYLAVRAIGSFRSSIGSNESTNQTAQDDFASKATSAAREAISKMRLFFKEGFLKIEKKSSKVAGSGVYVLDLANIGVDQEALNRAIALVNDSVNSAPEGRQASFLVVNSNPDLKDKEQIFFDSFGRLTQSIGITIQPIGYNALPRATNGEVDFTVLLQNTKLSEVAKFGEQGNVFVIGANQALAPQGTRFIQVVNNYVHFALILRASRLSDPLNALTEFVQLINDTLKINLLSITEQTELEKIADMMA